MASRDADLEARIADWQPRIERFLVSMIAAPDVAADLTQETCRRALDHLDQLRDPERLGAWLYSIAVNLCRAHLRRAVTRGEQSLAFDPEGARGSVLSSIVRREAAEALALAIDRLPILLREAFVLHAIEGLPYGEIAEITGANVNALHVRAHRAKGLLRRQLGAVVDTFWSTPEP